MWLLAIPISFIVLLSVYNFFIVPFFTKKEAAKEQDAFDKIKAKYSGTLEENLKQVIKSNPILKPIIHQIQEDNIKGIASCMEWKDTSGVIKEQLVNVAGKFVGKATGIGFKQKSNANYYFLVLTDKSLHYLDVNEDGDCEQHVAFDVKVISKVQLSKPSSSDVATGKALVQTQKLSFDSNGKSYSFFFYDDLYQYPEVDATEENYYEYKYFFFEGFKNAIQNTPYSS